MISDCASNQGWLSRDHTDSTDGFVGDFRGLARVGDLVDLVDPVGDLEWLLSDLMELVGEPVRLS